MICRILRSLFRDILDILIYYTDSHSTGYSSAPYKFEKFICRFYNIDEGIEFFIRNRNSKFMR